MKCVLMPKGPNGKDSELFKYFNENFDRDTAIMVYGMVRDTEFLNYMGDWLNDPSSYAGELGASAEPTVRDVETFMERHNTFHVTQNSSSRYARPKFQKLIEAKQIEMKEVSVAMSLTAKEKNEASTPRAKVAATKKLHTLRDKYEKIEDDIYRLSRASALEDMDEYAESDMQELENIFSNPDVTDADLQKALRIANLWIQAGDFSQKEHLFFDDTELEAVLNGVIPEVSEKFIGWAQRAMAFKKKFITPMSEQLIKDSLKDTFGENTEFDPDKAVKDKDFLTSNFLDIAETEGALMQGIAHWVKRANFEAHKEAENIFKQVEELASKLTSEELLLLQQTISNTDDRLTGNITHRFSQAYFDKMKSITYKFSSKVNALPTGNKKEFYRRLYEEYENLYKQKASMQIVVDPRIFYWDDRYTSATKPTQEQKDKHTEFLKKHLGEAGFKYMKVRAGEKVDAYAFDLETKKLELQEKYADELSKKDSSGYDLELKRWIYNNNPYLAAQFHKEGYKPSAERGVVIRPEKERYLVTAPRRTNFKGENTGMYDERFEQIEANEDLYAFYNYALNTLSTLRKYLPHFQTGHFQINTLPTIKKTVMEEFTRDKLGAGLAPLMDALTNATRTDDLTTVAGELDPLTGEPRKELQTQYMQDPSKEISDYVNRMTILFKQDTGKMPTRETIKAWKDEHRHYLAMQKSYDFVKVIKAFAMMGLTYKHKAVIADRMRIAQQIVDNQFETVTNAADNPMTTGYGAVLKKLKGLKNTKAMLDYFMDSAFWGYPKHKPEGQTKVGGKSYTKAEKAIKKELEEMLDRNEQQWASNEIEEGEYLNRKSVIEDQLEVLGGIKTASKYGDLALKYVGLKGLGWNVFAAVGNLGFGFISNIIEAADGRLYNVNEYRKAMWLLRHSVQKNFTFNKRETDTAQKIRKLMDRLDLLKELRNELYESSENSSGYSKIKKKFKWADPYAPQARSEYINQAAIMIAMMMHKKVTLNGEEIDLWDAYDANGQLIEGVEFNEEDEFKMKVKIDKMIKGAHGNYDTLDAPIKLKEKFFGRALSQFRTWAFMGFANRFQESFYDHQLEIERKGRYRSIFPFIKEVTNMMKEDGGIEGTMFILKQLTKKATFGYYNAEFNRMEGLSEVDRVNMRKNLMELTVYLSIAAFGLLLRGAAKNMDEDDPERGPIYFTINLLSRLQTDILFYINPVEFEKLLRNPLPIFSLVTDSYKAYTHAKHLMQGYEDTLASGPNKGESKTKRAVFKIIPGPVQYYKIKSAMDILYEKDPATKKDKSPWWEPFWSNNSGSLEGYRIGN